MPPGMMPFRAATRLSRQCLRAAERRSFAAAPVQAVATCPAPTCPCAATPTMSDGLSIDRVSPLRGVMAPYAEKVLVCTGQDDWASRIEEERADDNLAADLKELFGRGGPYCDPYHSVSVLNASFPSSVLPGAEVQNTSVYLLPSFLYVPFLPRVSFDCVRALAEAYLLPEQLHPAHDSLSPIHRDRLTRKPSYRGLLQGVRPVEEILVLVCGHGGRDARCGLFGPVLKEFEAKLERAGMAVLRGPRQVQAQDDAMSKDGEPGEPVMSARVGLVSHVGGHKFAGNAILYLPPHLRLGDGRHPLAGCGIWYGRVEPEHVEGLVQETVLGGKVVASMFRGGIDAQRKLLKL